MHSIAASAMSVASNSTGTRSMRKSPGSLVTERTPCNVCGSFRAKRLFTETYRLAESAAELGIVRCRVCGLVYVSPRLTFQSTQDVYVYDAENTVSHDYCWRAEFSEKRFRRLLDRLARLRPGGRLLDVGCGTGHLLLAARRRGRWEVVGVEPVESAAQQAEAMAQCRVYASTLEQSPLQTASFDVVAMLGVLEHAHDPLGRLVKAHELLKPSGILAVSVPNFHYLRIKDTGLASLFRRGRWSDLRPQEHLFQFTTRSLRMILETTHFQLVELDIGHPFPHGGYIKQRLKMCAYYGVRALWKLTGLHLGGIEAIARRIDGTNTRAAA